nr:ribosomal protein S6 [Cavernulicola chilensis]
MNELAFIRNLKNYELIYILRPDLSEENTLQIIEEYEDIIKNTKAKNVTVQNRGRRQLAYPINRLQDGIYVQVSFKGSGETVRTIEKVLRVSENIIRYKTTKSVKRLDDTPIS